MSTPTTPPPDENPFRVPEFAAPVSPYAAATYAAAPSVAVAPVRKLGAGVKVTLVAVVVLALGLGSLAAFGLRALILHSPATLAAGDCLYLSEDSAAEEESYHEVSCSSRSAVYHVDVVATGYSGCNGGDYVRFQIFPGTSTRGTPSKTLCLALNVISGDCLRDVEDDASVSKVNCDTQGAEVRAVVHGGSDTGVCGPQDRELDYPGPPQRAICLQPAGENI